MIDLFAAKREPINLPLLSCAIPAGFPSPADDFIEQALDLHTLLIRHPASTQLGKAEDNHLIHLGIHQNDILVIDRSLKPDHLNLVIATVNGELITRQFNQKRGTLTGSSPDSLIHIKSSDVLINGVLTYSIRSHYDKHVEDVSDPCSLKRLLIKNITATFLARADGDSLIGAGIFDKDYLIIDRSLKAFHGKLVVAAIEGEFLVKRFDSINGLLISENPNYPPFDVNNQPSLYIEGVITFSIRSHYWK